MSSKFITERKKEKTPNRHPKFLFFVKILILLAANLGCQTEIQTVQESRILMDTMVSIHVYAAKPADEPAIRRAMAAAFAEMSRLDSLLSAYRRDSEVAAINQNAAAVSVTVSSDMDCVLRIAQWAAQISNGAFDVTIAPLLRLWGFGTDSLGLPAPEKIAARLPLVNSKNLVVSNEENSPKRSVHFRRPDMAIDLGGVAKGYVVDRGLAKLMQAGLRDAMITAGGDLRTVASPLTAGRRYIWIQHPRATDLDSTQNQTGAFWGRFKLDAGAVSTSGDYERFFFKDGKRYHHLIDPHTGYPARRAVSATVIARQAVVADALSTTLFVLGPERGIALADSLAEVDAVIIYEEEKLKWRATQTLENKLEVFHQ
ncbi:MAG: FAD:protein FMN transferase [candidate division KSB1 bacterium]|nr:FAD:protein FMN transferase [candidate division KSB1 bacterium]